MIFFDINTFYYASDGGIKTFYNAKIDWFKKHPEHKYFLISANSNFQIDKISQNVYYIQVYGLKGIIGKNRVLLIDYWKVLLLIRQIKPDIIEAGDPLFTSVFTRILFRSKLFRGFLSCFHHSDPIATYIIPWAYGENSNVFKKIVARMANTNFNFFHKHYPYTLVASQSMKTQFEKRGLENISVFPFGVQEIFRDNRQVREERKATLLFAGRLEHEKGIYLIKKILPRLLKHKEVVVTVIGNGRHENFFKEHKHPRLNYLGYVKDPRNVESIYRQNNIFLAPGPYEAFGIGVLEAISNGMIVIGPDSGGTGELLASLNSPFIFKSGDPESFYQTILKAIECDFEKESRRSIEKSKEFLSWNDALDQILFFYENEANNHHKKQNEEKGLNLPS